jgi:hypothetical protein
MYPTSYNFVSAVPIIAVYVRDRAHISGRQTRV